MESEHDRGSQILKFLLSCGECVYLGVCVCVLSTSINMHMYVFILVESKM